MNSSQKAHEGNLIKKFTKNSPWYLISNVLTRGFSFLLLPIYTSYLDPSSYGIMFNVVATGNLMVIIFSFYLDSAFGKYYFDCKNDNEISDLFSTHFFAVTIWSTICLLPSIYFVYVFFDSAVSILLLSFYFISLVLNQLSIMVLAIWKARIQAIKVSIIQIFTSLINIILSLTFLIILDLDWEAKIYGLIFSNLLQFLILLGFTLKNKFLFLKFNFSILQRSLKFCIPLIPNIFAGWLVLNFSRLFFGNLDQLENAGLYSFAIQIGLLVYILQDAITKVSSPILFSSLAAKDKRSSKLISKTIENVNLVVLPLYLFISLFSEELLFFINEKYKPAFEIIPIIGLAYVLGVFNRILNDIILALEKTWVISVGTIFQGIFGALLSYFLIMQFDLVGSSISFVLSTLFLTLWLIFFCNSKHIRIHFPFKAVFLLFFFSLVGISSNWYIDALYLKLILFAALMMLYLSLGGKKLILAALRNDK
jgi:O-antigen/teichoic acid export membrane protein